METIINMIPQFLVSTPLIIIYFAIGGLIALFSFDHPNTKWWMALGIFLFWPAVLIVLTICSVIGNWYKKTLRFLVYITFGIWIEKEWTGSRCGLYTAKYKEDMIIINTEDGRMIFWKPDIEEQFSEEQIKKYRDPQDTQFLNDEEFWTTGLGKFWIDLGKFSKGGCTLEYMQDNYSDLCLNLMNVLNSFQNFN